MRVILVCSVVGCGADGSATARRSATASMGVSYHELSRISTVARAAVTVLAVGGTMRALLALSVLAALGCGRQLTASAPPQEPYTASRTTVIGTDSSGNTVDGSTNE